MCHVEIVLTVISLKANTFLLTFEKFYGYKMLNNNFINIGIL